VVAFLSAPFFFLRMDDVLINPSLKTNVCVYLCVFAGASKFECVYMCVHVMGTKSLLCGFCVRMKYFTKFACL